VINVYPANRLENLVVLLDKVMQTGDRNAILSEEIILVQSQGMQHWLNLQLAQSRGISMNLSFSLPMAFFWTQIRTILGKEHVPETSAYTREVLSWRLYDLLGSDEIINNPECQEANDYWSKNGKNKAHKRFQLACQLADLFEQYLIFRPDWLLAWEDNKKVTISATYQIENNAELWQAILWRALVAQNPQHPVALLKKAMACLANNSYKLADRISLFGINTLPPLWLEFLSQLGDYSQIHFFHLNPCVAYWGDLKTDKSYAKEQFYRWLKSSDYLATQTDEQTSNPLLANLGKQGKEFIELLSEYIAIEIPIYESPTEQAQEQGTQGSVLQQIQTDILQLYDARNTGSEKKWIDDSITIVSAHNALREIQALHDWLLLQINDPANKLTPKDILVMCPNIENYAPYVDAVFAHGWHDWSEQVPPLPCSIADRSLKDSEPLVQAFISLLELPDSRFQVSQLVSYLRLPAIQKKFNFLQDDLLILERWIQHAHIHWGLDKNHKEKILDGYAANDKFSWYQGLKRLLLGFAYSDQNSLYDEQLLLADVEGEDALLLGHYLELLEQLKHYAQSLQIAKTAVQWQVFLLQLKEDLFQPLSDDDNAQRIIEQAIDDLGEYTTQAELSKPLPLTIVRDFLIDHFSQVEASRQFMTGQVTFCSMIPMRSVPFRIIAVLGLNDGEFPRQRQPMGFDLMACEASSRKGDRSRRGDDRYLFLEALISCREKLYLSYQGHDSKTNNKREPSLVLHELMTYLEHAYGWQLSEEDKSDRIAIPLQAFSKDNYQSKANKKALYSFNANWLKLSEPCKSINNIQSLKDFPIVDSADTRVDKKQTLTAEDLVAFFDNPCKQLAQQRLGLYFESYINTPDDIEPFVSNHLDRYLIQDDIIRLSLSQDGDEQSIDEMIKGVTLSGQLPDIPSLADDLSDWQKQACEFANYIRDRKGDKQLDKRSVSLSIDHLTISAHLPVLDKQLLYWRLANPKGKDDMRLWVHHLIAQVTLGEYVTQGIFRSAKDTKLTSVLFPSIAKEIALQHLETLIHYYHQGMQEPLLLNASLAQKHCLIKQTKTNKTTQKPLSEQEFINLWQDAFQAQSLGSDPYIHWFFKDQCPDWQGHWQKHIERLYQPLYELRQETTHND